MPEPVAVIAASARTARDTARRLSAASGIRATFEPFTPASYLHAAAAPSRIVLCAPSGAADAAAFLRRWTERLLWPAPPAELHDAIDGIRPAIASPRRVRAAPESRARTERASARLLEGTVDAPRAAAALDAGPPLDWIVESARHVRMSRSELAVLASRGVRWSVLDPVEILGVYGEPSLARSRGEWGKALPRRVPLWSGDGTRTSSGPLRGPWK
jgi:hypothetical protein